MDDEATAADPASNEQERPQTIGIEPKVTGAFIPEATGADKTDVGQIDAIEPDADEHSDAIEPDAAERTDALASEGTVVPETPVSPDTVGQESAEETESVVPDPPAVAETGEEDPVTVMENGELDPPALLDGIETDPPALLDVVVPDPPMVMEVGAVESAEVLDAGEPELTFVLDVVEPGLTAVVVQAGPEPLEEAVSELREAGTPAELTESEPPETVPTGMVPAEQSEQETSARQAQRAATRATKESLIVQAELVAMVSPASSAPGEMKALLEQWKKAGRTTKAEDDALWARFNSAQDQLFTRLDLLREQRQAEATEAKRLKESLIATAEEVAERSDIRQAAETMASLMAQWKQIGQAPDDKGLWLRFKAAQDRLYARRNEERDKTRIDHQQAADLKRSLIARAQGLVGSPDLRQANAELRDVQVSFREAGYAGRDNKKLGDQFRQAQQEFYAWVRKEPTRRKETGQQPVYGRRARLMQQIEQVTSQIAQAEKALQTTDPSGAKKSHGTSITVTLGQSGAYSSAAAEVMRLKISLADLESQVRALDAKLGREN